MGKGDIRSRRGKVWRGTTGVTRPRKRKKNCAIARSSRKVKGLKALHSEGVEQQVVVGGEQVSTIDSTKKAKKPRKATDVKKEE